MPKKMASHLPHTVPPPGSGSDIRAAASVMHILFAVGLLCPLGPCDRDLLLEREEEDGENGLCSAFSYPGHEPTRQLGPKQDGVGVQGQSWAHSVPLALLRHVIPPHWALVGDHRGKALGSGMVCSHKVVRAEVNS